MGPRAQDSVARKAGDPLPPADPAAAAAYDVLDRHCARCHQSGRSPTERVHGGIADILDLDALGRAGAYVRAGEPDASALFHALYSGHAPLGVLAAAPAGEPGAAEVAAVREWIRRLAPSPQAACSGRTALAADHAQRFAGKAIADAGDGARSLRFVTLAHLRNACATVSELAAHRDGLARLLNALSWTAAPVALDTLDPEATVFRIDLAAFAWSAAQWDDLTAGYPLANLPALAKSAPGPATSPPIITADWLAAASQDPVRYAKMMMLPDTLADLELRLQVEGIHARGQLARSVETEAPREIERLNAPRPVWLARDRAPDGSSSIRLAFGLPNDFRGFAVFDSTGARLDASSIEPEDTRKGWTPRTLASTACLSCHTSGPRVSDPAQADLSRLAADDARQHAAAVRRVTQAPPPSAPHADPVGVLAAAYASPVTLVRAAAELGYTPAGLDAVLRAVSGRATAAAQRLRRSSLPRSEALAVYVALLSGGPASPVPPEVERPAGKPYLSIWPDADVYRVDQVATFLAEASEDCYLTLVNVDARGRATVLFPSDFERSNAIAAGRRVAIPSPDEPYRFRLTEPGRETLVGICTKSPRPIDTIRHDFDRLRFTALGDWLDFQDRAYDLAGKPPVPERQRRQVRRRGAPPAAPLPERRGFEPQMRAAVTFEVR